MYFYFQQYNFHNSSFLIKFFEKFDKCLGSYRVFKDPLKNIIVTCFIFFLRSPSEILKLGKMFLSKQMTLNIRTRNKNKLTSSTPHIFPSFQAKIVSSKLLCKTITMNVLRSYVTTVEFFVLLKISWKKFFKLKFLLHNFWTRFDRAF